MNWIKRWTLRALIGLGLILGTLVVGGAWEARWRHPDLKAWHRVYLDDVTASDLDDDFTLTDYLAREERLFAEVRALEQTIESEDRTPVNRYNPGSRVHPLRASRDWNRTFELEPDEIRGGALLVHGLTDAPYSMRAVADVLRESGFYTLALRMPGHGTLPTGLASSTWRDWLAATSLGVRHVRQKIGPDRPLLLVGYSNGGALVLKYTLDAVAAGRQIPSSVVLLSPMMGVTPAAWLSWWISRLGVIPYFEKARWLDVIPEFNPFKYNSFPANAAFQTASITRALNRDLQRAAESGAVKALPPILTFQSSVDATVSTPAIIQRLYDRLPANGSELVLFDVNQVSGINVFVRPEDRTLVGRLFDPVARSYRRVLVTNVSETTTAVEARVMEAGRTEVTFEPIDLSWPAQVFSLTHVAIPFPVDDDLYGIDAAITADGLLALGRLSPRGERAVLTVGTDTLMRLTSNPFYPFMADRIARFVQPPSR